MKRVPVIFSGIPNVEFDLQIISIFYPIMTSKQ